MVQPKYSPEEALQRIKLMMEYKTSKTLDENIQMISEQPSPGEVAATTAGAGIGAATVGGAGAAYTAASTGAGLAGVGSGLAGLATVSVLGPAAVGAVAAYGLYKLVKWYANKDLGKSGFAQVMSVCTAPGMSKMIPKMSKGEIRNLAYAIEDAKGDWNDDEDAIVSVFQKVETIADLCALDKKVTGGLVEFLDNLTDSPDEWKMFTRPLAGMIEDTEIVLTPQEQKKLKGIPGDAGPARKKTGGYKSCSGTYSYGCKANAIAEVQGCLGLTTDGKFGPKTKAALSGKGFTTFTDKDVTKICSKTTTIEKPQDEFSVQVDGERIDDILNM